jgi:hypothetical protein
MFEATTRDGRSRVKALKMDQEAMDGGEGEEKWKKDRGGRYLYRRSPTRQGAWDHALVQDPANQE